MVEQDRPVGTNDVYPDRSGARQDRWKGSGGQHVMRTSN